MRNSFMCRPVILLLVSLLFTAAGWAEGEPAIDTSKEFPVRIIPDIPAAAEAYYGPDDYHLIVQAQDPDAQKPAGSKRNNALIHIFTDDGKLNRRINDRGQDGCSWFFPDGKRVLWTSTRDRMDMP
ncbi:MAG: hypothetical protein KDI87_11195, partial [Gammaproteobacteria bacterium]|nr:hypothetical protein [Gammaproteobacteria bacterium]